MKDQSLREVPCMEDHLFPVSISECSHHHLGMVFPIHWHKHHEFLYITHGEGIIECNTTRYSVKPGDLVVVNSGELHSGYNCSDILSYYCIIVDPSILNSNSGDACEIKYLTPILQNLILFENIIHEDQAVIGCIQTIIEEYRNQDVGFELSIKSCIYRILTLLIRSHRLTTLTLREYALRKKELERLNPVFNYIEKNFQDKISVAQLASLANLSSFHFCRLFKKLTDKTVTDYVNSLRISKAASLLTDSGMSITEAALAAGFNDINYFSRTFKKYKNESPSAYRQKIQYDSVSS